MSDRPGFLRRIAEAPPRWALPVVVFAGLAARLWQYLGNASFWIDELALVDDVLHIPLRALVARPLPLDQIAPPALLAALKASSEWLGDDERALRLFPFACALASVVLFAALARRVLPPWTAVFASAIFALLPLLISWSASVKQYSTDVAVSIAVTLAALRLVAPQVEARARYRIAAAAIGAAAPWLSHPAAFTVAGCGAALVAMAIVAPVGGDRRRTLAPVAGVVLAWAASAGAAVALSRSLLTESTRDYMARFWEPSLPGLETLALLALGAFLLAKRGPKAASVLFAPVALTLAAAAAHVYPFSGRSVLFLVPVFVLAAAEAGALLVAGIAALRVPRPAAAALVVVPLLVWFAGNLPVYEREEMRPLLARLAGRVRNGDVLYVYYGAGRAFRFYAPRAGIPVSRAVPGCCHRGDPRGYLREVDAFRGSPRVWVIVAHPAARLREVPALLGYLGRIGAGRERIAETGAFAELYDLSDPVRLTSANAEDFPVATPAPDSPSAYDCAHGPIARAPWE